MDLVLSRTDYLETGIFGVIRNKQNDFICVTLEHSYIVDGSFTPKVSAGLYVCKKHAPNRLKYWTYELQDVPPFQGKSVDGVLVHIGNYHSESQGCILVGEHKSEDNEMIIGSKLAFDYFMGIQKGLDSFQLEIIE
jgi:hypothetical protein